MSLISNLVWPMVVLVVFFALRRPIAKLIPRLRRFQGPGGWGADFDEEVSKVGEDLENVAETTGRVTDGKGALDDSEGVRTTETISEARSSALTGELDFEWATDLKSIARVSPQGAIVGAFSYVEQEVRLIARPYGHPGTYSATVRALAKGGVISEDMASVLQRLGGLRNNAVHHEIDPEGAEEYVDLAASTVGLLRPR